MAGRIKIDSERCKGCDLCVRVCPPHILVIGANPNSKGYYTVEMQDESKCTGCTFCALVCPDLALEVYRLEQGE